MSFLSTVATPALALRASTTRRFEALSPRQRKVSGMVAMVGVVAFTSLVSAEPAFAQTNLDSFATSVLNLLSNGLLRTIAVIAVIAVGLGWFMGRVNTGALVTVVIGIAIVFSAPWIVDQLNSGGG